MSEWVLVIGGMTLTEESRSTRKRPQSRCHFFQHKSCMVLFGIKPRLPRRQTAD